MPALAVRIVEARAFERDVQLRLPFRFGAVTLCKATQAFLRVRVESAAGRLETGVAAELMVPKWFDKRPELSDEENVDQLRASLAGAVAAAPGSELAPAFAHHALAPVSPGVPPLVAGFGPSLVDRAVIDGACRLAGLSFQDAVRDNALGLDLPGLGLDEPGFHADAFLATLTPYTSVALRHTVGLADPIGRERPHDAPDDGLPVTLLEVIERHAPRFFKIKFGGDLEAGVERLGVIARLLEAHAGDYRVTLDGNEQFADAAAAEAWLHALRPSEALSPLLERVLYLEQPIARARALEEDVTGLARFRPVLLDESDDSDEAFVRARACGYQGVSSKACKGVYRSLLNAARCAAWNAREGRPRFFLSGEDLTTQAGVALQQDLALAALLGIEHVERNGHHYVNGMWGVGDEEMDAFAVAHPDLYERDASGLHLAIRDGTIATGSLLGPGFARGAEPDWSRMREIAGG